jgi:hypothetical protein
MTELIAYILALLLADALLTGKMASAVPEARVK